MLELDKFSKKGTKKLFSLTRTKIRLAEEEGTTRTKPDPLPLVAKLSGYEIGTIAKAKSYMEVLRENLNFNRPAKVSRTVMQLMDIVEGVKYEYETRGDMFLLSPEKLQVLEDRAREGNLPVNILLLTDAVDEGINVYVGDGCPQGLVHACRSATSLATFIDYALDSDYFGAGRHALQNLRFRVGRKTLIIDAVAFALSEMGVEEILVGEKKEKKKGKKKSE